jgi:hypothetical protein
MQASELLVARERQVDGEALLIRPAVAPARENSVEPLVGEALRIARPKPRGAGIEPGVHRRGHEAQPLAAEPLVRRANGRGEGVRQAIERAPRCLAAELEDVQRKRVAEFDGAVLDRCGAGFEELVGARRRVEALTVDEHVLDRDPVALEQTGRPFERRVRRRG